MYVYPNLWYNASTTLSFVYFSDFVFLWLRDSCFSNSVVLVFPTSWCVFIQRFDAFSELVQSCTASRPITVYQRGHNAPFYPGFVAMVPQDLPTPPWRCRQGFDCLVTCPFLSNGDVRVSMSRMSGGAPLVVAEGRESEGTVWRLGQYFGKARFLIRAFNRARDSGNYLCRVSSESKTVISSVSVHWCVKWRCWQQDCQ